MALAIKIINRLRHYRLSTRAWVHTRYMYAFSHFYGIRLGRDCKFWKQPVIYMEHGSEIEIGNRCVFRSDFDSNLIGVTRPCIISTHSPQAIIKIGDDCGFSGVSIGVKEHLEIGNNVIVGANSYITDFDWHALDPLDRDNPRKIVSKEIVIEDNVWLGLNCIVLKGVRIGRNSIIGAGSVITKDMPADSICAGSPCRVLKTVENTPLLAATELPAQVS